MRVLAGIAVFILLAFAISEMITYADYAAMAAGIAIIALAGFFWLRKIKSRLVHMSLAFAGVSAFAIGIFMHGELSNSRNEADLESQRAEVRRLIQKEQQDRASAQQPGKSGSQYSNIPTDPESLKLRQDYSACMAAAVKGVAEGYAWAPMSDTQKQLVLAQNSPAIRDDRDRCLRNRGWTSIKSQAVRDIDETFRNMGVVLF